MHSYSVVLNHQPYPEKSLDSVSDPTAPSIPMLGIPAMPTEITVTPSEIDFLETLQESKNSVVFKVTFQGKPCVLKVVRISRPQSYLYSSPDSSSTTTAAHQNSTHQTAK